MSNPYSSGLNVLTVEDEIGHYQIIAVVSNSIEAKELAAADMVSRERRLLADEDPGLCPYEYCLWSRNANGEYVKEVL